MSIAENVALVRENIRQAALAAGRDPKDVLLLAATKMNDENRVRQAIAAGVDACGENRVQEMLEKQEKGAYTGTSLHFIGHLQKNKAKFVVGLAELIHGVDSVELMAQIDRLAAQRQLRQDILLEINIGREVSKSGFAPEELPAALEAASAFGSIRVRGLMAIPPAGAPGESRGFFQKTHQLYVDIIRKLDDNRNDVNFLSMGMSGDFEDAITEGATQVRVGTALFGARPPMRANG
jgi:pyridoxal phosphate enzyme (YggS family)